MNASSPRHARLARKLSAYTAAGVSLAAAQAKAAIINTELSSAPMSLANGVFELDLNQDGLLDFSLIHEVFRSTRSRNCTTLSSGFVTCSTVYRILRRSALIRGGLGNATIADEHGVAANLLGGAVIDPLSTSTTQQALIGQYQHIFFTNSRGDNFSSYSSDGWIGATSTDYFPPSRGYLGLTFVIAGGGRHAAWAEVEVGMGTPPLKLFGYAYESVANRPLMAGAVPEPPSLVLLAAGAIGLTALRKKRGATIRA